MGTTIGQSGDRYWVDLEQYSLVLLDESNGDIHRSYTKEQFEQLVDALHPSDYDDVTRVVTIGPENVWEQIGVSVRLELQDEGRTLKIFTTEREGSADILAEYIGNMRRSLRDAQHLLTLRPSQTMTR